MKHHLIHSIHFLILLFLCTISPAQDLQIKEIFRSNENTTVTYPVFILKSKTASKAINDEIAKTMFDGDPLDSLLKTEDNVGFTFLSYSINLKTNTVLSFTIDGEWMSAYPSSGSNYFNFNLNSGKRILISEIVNSKDSAAFRKMIFAEKIKHLEKYKEELSLDLKNGNVEQEDYDYVIELINGCMLEISLDNFVLTDSGIEIKDECGGFPHVIQSMAPVYDLKYSYTSIENFLNPEWKALIKKMK